MIRNFFLILHHRQGKDTKKKSNSQYLVWGKIKKNKVMQTKKKEIKRYMTKFINQNFRIKVFGRDESGRKINTLMGVSGIIRLIGEELFYKFIQRALDCMNDVCVCKLRRGLQVSLYVK